MATTVRLSQEIEDRLDRLAWEYAVAQRATELRTGKRGTVYSAQAKQQLGLDD